VPGGLARTSPDSLLDVWGRPTDARDTRSRRPAGAHLPSTNGTAHSPASSSVVRTALCVEPRNGKLYVFMPPARYIEDYLELVAAIETTAAKLDRPVMIEGYKPPHDHRVRNFSITPDPGVIEVTVTTIVQPPGAMVEPDAIVINVGICYIYCKSIDDLAIKVSRKNKYQDFHDFELAGVIRPQTSIRRTNS